MATENQIQTFARLLRRLGVMYAKIAGRQSSALEVFSKQELLTVDVLGVRGSCRMGEIAEYLGVVQSAITPLVDRLEAQGIVQRVRSHRFRNLDTREVEEIAGKTIELDRALDASGLELVRVADE